MVEGGGRGVGGLGRGDYGLSIAMGEGLAEVLPREVRERFKHHLFHWADPEEASIYGGGQFGQFRASCFVY